jgi:hypothetical protein
MPAPAPLQPRQLFSEPPQRHSSASDSSAPMAPFHHGAPYAGSAPTSPVKLAHPPSFQLYAAPPGPPQQAFFPPHSPSSVFTQPPTAHDPRQPPPSPMHPIFSIPPSPQAQPHIYPPGQGYQSPPQLPHPSFPPTVDPSQVHPDPQLFMQPPAMQLPATFPSAEDASRTKRRVYAENPALSAGGLGALLR